MCVYVYRITSSPRREKEILTHLAPEAAVVSSLAYNFLAAATNFALPVFPELMAQSASCVICCVFISLSLSVMCPLVHLKMTRATVMPSEFLRQASCWVSLYKYYKYEKERYLR